MAMNSDVDVKYITVESKALETVPIVDGQVICIMDKDAWFYDMDGARHTVTGQKITTQLPEDTSSLYPNTLIIVTDGEDKGIWLWDGIQFVPIASINSDENVVVENGTFGKAYLAGTTDESGETATHLVKLSDVYLDMTTGQIYAKGFKGGPAEKATNADNAAKAEQAKADYAGNDIQKTYISGISISGTQVTITRGDGTTEQQATQDTDTHSVTGLVITDSDTSKVDSVADNGEVRMNIMDDDTIRSSHLVVGEGSVEVTADSEGKMTISGENTWEPNTKDSEGYVSPGKPNKIWSTDDEGNPDWRDPQKQYEHPTSGVTPGTYKSVTVDDKGHVTDGTNPTTLEGYGITDAVPIVYLQEDADLNTVKTAGIYIGTAGNSIQNKPSEVTSFAVACYPTSDGFYLTQKLYSSGEGESPHAQYTRQAIGGQFTEWSEDKLTDTVYVHPNTPGYFHLPQGGTSGDILKWSSDGRASWGAPSAELVPVMKGATEEEPGEPGIVPGPDAGLPDKFLRNDGTWSIPDNTQYIPFQGATTEQDGQEGLVPKPTSADSTKFLAGDGTWKTIEIPKTDGVWMQFPEETS